MDKPWYVYMLLCRSQGIYTGITPNLPQRIKAHAEGKGALFTKQHPPERLLAVKLFPTKREAASVEHRIKKLSKRNKLLMVQLWVKENPLNHIAEKFPPLVQYIQ